MSLGTTAPVNSKDSGLQLATGYSTGTEQKFTVRSQLESSGGFLGLNPREAKPFILSPGPIVWATVKNQFFSAILTPDVPASGLITRRVKLDPNLPDSDRNAYGITVRPNSTSGPGAQGPDDLKIEMYVGPNEYRRLANATVFKADQDKVDAVRLLPLLLRATAHADGLDPRLRPELGRGDHLTTLALKVVCLPLTLVASRAAKRMQKLHPHIQALKEKYKDNPQKQQTATMELFKQHKVNPLGGCIPMLITMPFFSGSS